MTDESTTTTIHVRVPTHSWEAFVEKCIGQYHRKPNDVLRELIKATAEGRVTITPTQGQQTQNKDLYL